MAANGISRSSVIYLTMCYPETFFLKSFEVEHEFPRIGFRSMSLNARRICSRDRTAQRILLAMGVLPERLRIGRISALTCESSTLWAYGRYDLQEREYTP